MYIEPPSHSKITTPVVIMPFLDNHSRGYQCDQEQQNLMMTEQNDRLDVYHTAHARQRNEGQTRRLLAAHACQGMFSSKRVNTCIVASFQIKP